MPANLENSAVATKKYRICQLKGDSYAFRETMLRFSHKIKTKRYMAFHPHQRQHQTIIVAILSNEQSEENLMKEI